MHSHDSVFKYIFFCNDILHLVVVIKSYIFESFYIATEKVKIEGFRQLIIFQSLSTNIDGFLLFFIDRVHFYILLFFSFISGQTAYDFLNRWTANKLGAVVVGIE